MRFETLKFITFQLTFRYVIVYKKGYQEFDSVISTVTTKLKGTAYVNFTDHFYSPMFEGIQVYDPADYVIPAQENNAFFVMTNMILTPNQTQAKCPEDPRFVDNQCDDDDDCSPALMPVRNGNGVRTGKCVVSDRNGKVKVCEIYGWCPTEVDKIPMPDLHLSGKKPLLEEAKNFTLLLKNQISFPKFKVQRRNVNTGNNSFLKNCIHDGDSNKNCPVFVLNDIIKDCGDTFEDVAFFGAVYGILLKWDCNLDYSLDDCVPTYSFKRLDDPISPISPGFNFRYASYYVVDGKRYRILTKAYGLKFEVIVSGRAGKFSPAPLFTNLGAGLALLGIASVMCDLIVMYCLKKRKQYKNYKYQRIEDDISTDDDFGSDLETTPESAKDEEELISKKVNVEQREESPYSKLR